MNKHTNKPRRRRPVGTQAFLPRLIASLLAVLVLCQLLFPLQAFAQVVPAEPEAFEAGEKDNADDVVTPAGHKQTSTHRTDLATSEKVISKNLALTANFIDSGYLYEIDFFSDMDSARFIIGIKFPVFERLCSEEETLNSIETLLKTEADDHTRMLLFRWYDYLHRQFRGGEASSLASQYGFKSNSNDWPDTIPHSITLPGGKILSGEKYIGNATPPNYTGISNYPSARLISPKSYRYNCFSYAWYLHGDINSHSPQMIFDNIMACAGPEHNDARVGDVVVYSEYHNGSTDKKNHAAIVTSVSGSNVYVKSKWRYYAVYSHKVEDCPFWAPMVTHGNSTDGITLTYYTLYHSYILHNGYYYCRGCGLKIPVPANGGVEHEMQ